jgi:3-hydroxyisobutyrate dehydrogenase-like beta-hydroxyacid dehydrogenase
MVGSTEEQFVQWAPLFGSLSRELRLAGPIGKATSLKLALN